MPAHDLSTYYSTGTIMHAIRVVEMEIERESDWGVAAVNLWLTLNGLEDRL